MMELEATAQHFKTAVIDGGTFLAMVIVKYGPNIELKIIINIS